MYILTQVLLLFLLLLLQPQKLQSILSSTDFAKHLSFVHYNVESVFPKLDVLFAELCDLDITAFSETWLNSSITNDDLLFQLYHSPEHKDA